MPAKPIPPGYTTLTPTLCIESAKKAIEFYVKAFGAETLDVTHDPAGEKVLHSALRIGDAIIFVSDTFPEMGANQSQSSMWMYVPDIEASFKRAVDAGAAAVWPPTDMFWGDRMGVVVDPFGQRWTIATHVRDMTKEEMKRAQDEFFAKQP